MFKSFPREHKTPTNEHFSPVSPLKKLLEFYRANARYGLLDRQLVELYYIKQKRCFLNYTKG